MCNQNITQILNIDHSSSNDEFNWITNSVNPINTISGQLVLKPDVQTATFRRGLGTLDPTNDRIRLQINMDLFRPQNSTQDQMNVVFGIYSGSNLIDQFTIYKQIGIGEKVEYNFDRIYKYDQLSGNISLKISFINGWQNELLFDYIKCEHFKYCHDLVRTYFLLNNYLEDSLNAVSSGIQLLEWKVNGIETLTPSFYSENNSIGGNLVSRKFAKANIDGSNRVSENLQPNSLNPFVDDLGLEFDETNSFFGGKALSTISGSNYGSEILKIGIDKPEILNGQLVSKKGAFFIDADFSNSFKIVFYSIINNLNNNVFQNPSIFRKYFIVWNSQNCTKQFYYQDQLSKTPLTNIFVDEDGFLSGLTNGVSTKKTISCNESFAFDGQSGVQEILIDFGTTIGIAGINYEASLIPDKFEIEWNGQILTTGYVGSNSYDQDLINVGVNQTEINTSNPPNGNGILNFFKDQPFPTTAILRVYAPLNLTRWSVSGICPKPLEQTTFTEITWNDTQTTENRTGTNTQETIYNGGVFYQVSDQEWERSNGGVWNVDPLVPNLTNLFNLDTGLNKFRLKAIKVLDNSIVYSNVLIYNKTEIQGGDVLSLRSTESNINGDNACNFNLTENCYLQTFNPNGIIIQTGDKIFNINQTPFNGQNKYWLLKSSIASSFDPSFVCLIDNNGNIQVYSICN